MSSLEVNNRSCTTDGTTMWHLTSESLQNSFLLCQHRFPAKSILFMAVPNLDSVAVQENSKTWSFQCKLFRFCIWSFKCVQKQSNLFFPKYKSDTLNASSTIEIKTIFFLNYFSACWYYSILFFQKRWTSTFDHIRNVSHTSRDARNYKKV